MTARSGPATPRKSRKKRSTELTLSPEARAKLEALAARRELTLTGAVEWMLEKVMALVD